MEVFLNERQVNVKIVRKNNKNIYFRFDEYLNLVVTVNSRVSEREIKKLILQNEPSLERMMQKYEKKVQKEQEFWYLGNKYEVLIDKNTKDIEFNNRVIICESNDALAKFIKWKIKEIFNYEVDKMREVIKTPSFTIRLRKMKTRWGVCNYKDNIITLNTELIKYNKNLLRYVIVHEMCHFYHHNHGKLFWNMVEKYYPNYKEARKELRS